MSAVLPIALGPNQPPDRFYRGGPGIARFRGLAPDGDHVPEDWVASTTTLFGEEELGLSRLPSGTFLRDAVRAEPVAWLGDDHLRRYGADPALLVKLLDAGQRLPVHVHPDGEFARRHLDCPYGKTEAWVIVDAPAGDGRVHLGFARDVDADLLARWVAAQDGAAMLAAMHAVPVRPGDGVLVPAGLPHAIGAGVLLIELQEPTDLSVLLEWKEYGLDGGAGCSVGLGFETALRCVNRRAWSDDQLARLIERHSQATSDRRRPLPAAADRFFRSDWLDATAGSLRLEPGFAVLVVLGGSGELKTAQGASVPLARGVTVVVPHGAGETRVEGAVNLLRCRPPAP